MNRILRILPFCLLTVSLFATSCKHTSLADMDAVFTKRMLVKATYETEWNYPIEGGIDWKNDPDWEETFHFPYQLLTPSLPDGLRVQLYLQDNKSSIFNIDPQGGEIPFTNGCLSRSGNAATEFRYMVPVNQAYEMEFIVEMYQGSELAGTYVHTTKLPSIDFRSNKSYLLKTKLTHENINPAQPLEEISFEVSSVNSWDQQFHN